MSASKDVLHILDVHLYYPGNLLSSHSTGHHASYDLFSTFYTSFLSGVSDLFSA